MSTTAITAIVVAVVVLLGIALLAAAVRIVKQYERGVLFRFGRLRETRQPGLNLIVPVADVLTKVSLRIVTLPIQSQGIITKDNVSVDIAAVAYYRVVDAVKSVVAIEDVQAAINQIAQTTLRNVVGSTRWTTASPRRTASTRTSARSWTVRPPSGASTSRSWSSRTSSCPTR
jgi:regulator of protease activity HflC (stomatin/prohibitin superfamily)